MTTSRRARERGPRRGAGPLRLPLGLRLAGAGVHLYTARGSVLGLLIVIAAFEGEAVTALWLGLAALLIDGTDGMLARRFRVKETIPWFDGARMDDIVDYLTYVFAPIVLLWTTDRLPDGPARLGGRRAAAARVLLPVLPGRREDAPTTSSWASRATGTSSPSTSIVLDVGADRRRRSAGRPHRPGVRAGPVRLPVADQGCCAGSTSRWPRVWLVTYAVLLAQYPDPNPVVVALSPRLPRLLRRAERVPHGRRAGGAHARPCEALG